MSSKASYLITAIVSSLLSALVIPYTLWRVFSVFSFIWGILVNNGSEEDIIELLIMMFIAVLLIIISVKLYKFTRIAWWLRSIS